MCLSPNLSREKTGSGSAHEHINLLFLFKKILAESIRPSLSLWIRLLVWSRRPPPLVRSKALTWRVSFSRLVSDDAVLHLWPLRPPRCQIPLSGGRPPPSLQCCRMAPAGIVWYCLTLPPSHHRLVTSTSLSPPITLLLSAPRVSLHSRQNGTSPAVWLRVCLRAPVNPVWLLRRPHSDGLGFLPPLKEQKQEKSWNAVHNDPGEFVHGEPDWDVLRLWMFDI